MFLGKVVSIEIGSQAKTHRQTMPMKNFCDNNLIVLQRFNEEKLQK